MLFDDENAMVRLDMSEFMERHTVSRLIGAPPGYVGYEEGGRLTEAVRRRPYSVVLLDEIEKAHRDVFNILLQVLDDGRLTDSHGHTVDFTNTIIVMTSNIGSQMIQESFEAGGTTKKCATGVMESLQTRFLPEFLNRIDEMIIFHPLDRPQIRKIVDLQVQHLAKQLEQRDFGLEVTDKARDELAARGYDPSFGARPLKRVIQQELQNPLASELLKGEFAEGSTIRIDYDGQDFTFEAVGGGNGSSAQRRARTAATKSSPPIRVAEFARIRRIPEKLQLLALAQRRHTSLPIDRREAPVRDNNLGARRHIANLAGNLHLLALRGLRQPLLQLRERFGPFAATADLFFAITNAHERFGNGVWTGTRLSPSGPIDLRTFLFITPHFKRQRDVPRPCENREIGYLAYAPFGYLGAAKSTVSSAWIV